MARVRASMWLALLCLGVRKFSRHTPRSPWPLSRIRTMAVGILLSTFEKQGRAWSGLRVTARVRIRIRIRIRIRARGRGRGRGRGRVRPPLRLVRALVVAEEVAPLEARLVRVRVRVS